jgi:hypothetical protein
MKVISLRLPDDLHAALSAEARDDGRSLNNYLIYKLAGSSPPIGTPKNDTPLPQKTESLKPALNQPTGSLDRSDAKPLFRKKGEL